MICWPHAQWKLQSQGHSPFQWMCHSMTQVQLGLWPCRTILALWLWSFRLPSRTHVQMLHLVGFRMHAMVLAEELAIKRLDYYLWLLSVCLSGCLSSVCISCLPSVSLSIGCLSIVCLVVSLSVYLSNWFQHVLTRHLSVCKLNS
jgi:hypothetical protein